VLLLCVGCVCQPLINEHDDDDDDDDSNSSAWVSEQQFNDTHTHTRLTALCPGLPGWAGTKKVKPIWILLKQETVSGSGIHWAICKSAPRSRQITTPVPHRSVFTGRMPFLPPNQQRQGTEGTYDTSAHYRLFSHKTLVLHSNKSRW